MTSLLTTRPIAFLVLTCLLISCAKDSHIEKEEDSRALMTRAEMDVIIREAMGEKELFYWNTASDRMIWSAAMQSDALLSVGICLAGQKDISKTIHEVDMQDERWQEAMGTVLEAILTIERGARNDASLRAEDILPPHLNTGEWPNLFFQVSSLNTVSLLRDHPNVRYVEPSGYSLESSQRSDSGCSNEPDYGIDSQDYSSLYADVKVPWNFPAHGIPQAWSTSTGEGKTIAIIDTGVSYAQENLDSDFSAGQSPQRNTSRYSTKWSGALWWATLDSPEDDCGHGTSMAGTATAPWAGDGNAVGVAYGADLVTVRGVEDVVITTSNESAGVRDALRLATRRADIISMSIGDPFHNSTVEDGIHYAYNHGRMILCAAGTSFSGTTWYGVVFPASMPETLAITGVKENPSNVTCDACHDGSEVDFVVVMERDADASRHSLALAMHSDQPSYIGGSSVATSTFAGMAAITWAAHPHWPREQVLQRMQESSEYYPQRDSDHGWGRVNVAEAVGLVDIPTLSTGK